MPRRKRRLEWADEAGAEYLEGLGYIAEDSPANAALVQGRIHKSAALLQTHSGLGKPGAVAGTREHPVPRTPFTLIYEIDGEQILIVHCWHQRRERH